MSEGKDRENKDQRLERLEFRISTDSKAYLLIEGDVTQQSIERLITYLELSKDSYPQTHEVLELTEKETAPEDGRAESSSLGDVGE